MLVTLAGVLPDVDGLTLLAGQEAYARWHHVLTHGALSALLMAATLAALSTQKRIVFGLGLLAFHLHLLCDLAGSGPGWPLSYLWPFSTREFQWNGQWDLASWQNALIGLVSTLATLWCAMPLGRTIVEVFSRRLDGLVVTTLRRRFGHDQS